MEKILYNPDITTRNNLIGVDSWIIIGDVSVVQ